MSQVIALQAIPNQSLTVNLDGNRYELRINDIGGGVAATISRNETVILSGVRVVAGTPMIPYRYVESGNFIIATENNDIPEHEKFGISQTLLYFSQSELEAIRAS